MLAALGFDTDEIPARRGPITLAELEYDEIDNYWHFRFRWDDIEIPVATKDLPAEIWRAISDDASPGETNTMIFGRSASSNWGGETPMIEILVELRDELAEFTQKMERLQALIAPLLPTK